MFLMRYKYKVERKLLRENQAALRCTLIVKFVSRPKIMFYYDDDHNDFIYYI